MIYNDYKVNHVITQQKHLMYNNIFRIPIINLIMLYYDHTSILRRTVQSKIVWSMVFHYRICESFTTFPFCIWQQEVDTSRI